MADWWSTPTSEGDLEAMEIRFDLQGAYLRELDHEAWEAEQQRLLDEGYSEMLREQYLQQLDRKAFDSFYFHRAEDEN